MKKQLWVFIGILSGTVILAVLVSLFCFRHIEKKANRYCVHSVSDLPDDIPVGLVLGTAARLKNGVPNPFFTERIKTSAQLYLSGKVKKLILSGDNSVEGYDEPEDMRQALLALGIPDSCLVLDYAGFRTLDSVLRSRLVFGQSKVIVVSQEFHNLRAVFLARSHQIEAYAMAAAQPEGSIGKWIIFREYLARVNACLDVYLLNKQAHFPGPYEPLEL